jgi:hypothetical protein
MGNGKVVQIMVMVFTVVHFETEQYLIKVNYNQLSSIVDYL